MTPTSELMVEHGRGASWSGLSVLTKDLDHHQVSQNLLQDKVFIHPSIQKHALIQVMEVGPAIPAETFSRPPSDFLHTSVEPPPVSSRPLPDYPQDLQTSRTCPGLLWTSWNSSTGKCLPSMRRSSKSTPNLSNKSLNWTSLIWSIMKTQKRRQTAAELEVSR